MTEGRQTFLPGSNAVIATYSCGHGRNHRIPSESVRVLKLSGGYEAVCDCGGFDLQGADEGPRHICDNRVLLSGVDESPGVWLALGEESDGWAWDPEGGDSFGKPTYRERREEKREEMRAMAEGQGE